MNDRLPRRGALHPLPGVGFAYRETHSDPSLPIGPPLRILSASRTGPVYRRSDAHRDDRKKIYPLSGIVPCPFRFPGRIPPRLRMLFANLPDRPPNGSSNDPVDRDNRRRSSANPSGGGIPRSSDRNHPRFHPLLCALERARPAPIRDITFGVGENNLSAE